MTEFDKKINIALHKFKIESGKATYEIADEAGISRRTMYNFTAGKRSLSGENTKKLMDLLNLTVELKEKA